jgi:uncharacterized protein YkwD
MAGNRIFDLLRSLLGGLLGGQPVPKPVPTPTPTPVPNPIPNVPPESFTAQLLIAHNKERTSPLILDARLNDVAQGHSLYQAKTGKMSHYGPGGNTFMDRLQEAGVYPQTGGENVAMGQRDVAAVMSAWMNSPGHRRNIQNSAYRRVGFGIVKLNGTIYWTAVFIGGEFASKELMASGLQGDFLLTEEQSSSALFLTTKELDHA